MLVTDGPSVTEPYGLQYVPVVDVSPGIETLAPKVEPPESSTPKSSTIVVPYYTIALSPELSPAVKGKIGAAITNFDETVVPLSAKDLTALNALLNKNEFYFKSETEVTGDPAVPFALPEPKPAGGPGFNPRDLLRTDNFCRDNMSCVLSIGKMPKKKYENSICPVGFNCKIPEAYGVTLKIKFN